MLPLIVTGYGPPHPPKRSLGLSTHCHVGPARCTTLLLNSPRVICCCWACHSRYLAASRRVSMLIARKPLTTGEPVARDGRRKKTEGVGSVPVGSAVCTVHTHGPELLVPGASPETRQSIFNPAERKVDPRIGKKKKKKKNRIATRWRCEHGNTHNKASRVLVKTRPPWFLPRPVTTASGKTRRPKRPR